MPFASTRAVPFRVSAGFAGPSDWALAVGSEASVTTAARTRARGIWASSSEQLRPAAELSSAQLAHVHERRGSRQRAGLETGSASGSRRGGLKASLEPAPFDGLGR